MKNKQKLFALSCIYVLLVSANTLYAKTERYSFDVFLWGIKVGELVYSVKKASDEYDISGVLRSKGFFWVEADHRIAYEWAQAGGVSDVKPAGYWWAAMPVESWGHPEDSRPDKSPNWHSTYGDRSQQIVFIGQGMEEEALKDALNSCLMDIDELDSIPEDWFELKNPFPELNLEEPEEEEQSLPHEAQEFTSQSQIN